MRYIIFTQKKHNRRDENKTKENVILVNHNFDFEIPKSAGCKTPFIMPHPTDKTKRLYHTVIYSHKTKLVFGFLIVEVSNEKEAFEVENTKEKYIIEIYNSGLMSRTMESLSAKHSNTKEIEYLLGLSRYCSDGIQKSLSDKDYRNIILSITIPSATLLMNGVVT